MVSCGNTEEFKETKKLDSQEREEVNAMMDAWMASDGKYIYIAGGGLVYRVDPETKQTTVNCNDLLCDHKSLDCSAKLSYSDTLCPVLRNGNHVYVISDKIYKISKNAKKEIGHGGYGSYWNKIIFGNYIAYFETEDTVVVKHIENDREVQRFEGIRGLLQGSFYYKGCLYYITDMDQLVRLDIKTGNMEVLEKKGATRASVYNGFIYYIKVSEETDTNFLTRMNPQTLETEELVEGVFYYNMMGDTLYYLSYPENLLYCSDLNGENRKEMPDANGSDWGFIWAFPQMNKLLLNKDTYTFYFLDSESGEVDYDGEIILPNEW